jgi:hypothetical protein
VIGDFSIKFLALASVMALVFSPIILADAQSDETETWTVMVYMSGDSSLSDQIPSDIQEMKKVGSGNGLEIIVLMDSSGIGDTSMARILKNGMTDIPLSSVNSSWGNELNMGNPGTLISFVTWTAENYPADRYMLDLWGHGNGWPGSCPDRGDYLEAWELGDAMKDISDAGTRIDLVSMDACQMGQVEVAYELRHGADYALLSQKDVPLNGWPYDLFLGHLKGTGNVTAKASAMIDSYITWGMSGNSLYSLTLSLIDLSVMDELADAIDAYSAGATLMTGYFNPEFAAARLATEKYDGNAQYDLVHLLMNINAKTECMRLETLSADVLRVIDNCVVHENHWTNLIDEPADNAHGLSIWFPGHAPTIDYMRTGFAKDNGWPDFLRSMATYFQQPGRTESPMPASVSSLDADSDGLLDSIRIIHQGHGVGVMTTVEIYGPNGNLFHEETFGASNGTTVDVALGSPGFYKAAIYQETSNGYLQNYSLVKNLARDGKSVIAGRVTSNVGRGMAWVGVALMDSNGKMIEQVFTDNSGFYRMEVTVPSQTNGTDLDLVCGLGSGQQNITIRTLGESFTADFEMKISSAYIPWVIRIVGFLNLLGIMMLVYWVAWGREKKSKEETEKLLVQQPIPPQ